MRGTCRTKILFLVLVSIFFCNIIGNPEAVYAAGNNVISGKVYQLKEDDDYDFTAAEETTAVKPMGTLRISGNLSDAGGMDGVTAYIVNKGNAEFEYLFKSAILDAEEGEWQLDNCNENKICGVKLDGKIKSGALIIESSLDGVNWTSDSNQTDIFASKEELSEAFYKTKDVQQENGCYYRIIIAYQLKKKTGEKKIGPIKLEEFDRSRYMEEYVFFLSNSSTGNVTSAADTPRKVLGEVVNTGKDNGFSKSVALDMDDPHFGMTLGEFTVNGYTRETEDTDGNPVFLKNVGDKVTLWFTLKQNIRALNNDPTLTIAEDKNAYDRYFQVPKCNFGHGALIIRYTDYQGGRHDPIVYTNYLEANAKTSADTRAQLFEEGDYEVSLDYEIKNSPRKVGKIEVVPTYTDYKIFFKFSIRNGNDMVYPIDLGSGQELFDGDITKSGFKLDMARSRYLTIDVKKTIINENESGILSEDVRFNRPAKDEEEYKDEGIYTFTVKNRYTDSEPTTKVVFVGEDKILKALSKYGLTVKELNTKLSSGAEIKNDGTIVAKSNSSRR